MKKSLLILMVLFSASFLSAQSYGVKAGLSISNLSSNNGDIDNTDAHEGLIAGVFVNFPLGLICIQPELNFTQKGASYTDLETVTKAHIDYIELPIGVQVNLLSPLYLSAGPQLSYLAKSKVSYEMTGDPEVIDEDESNYKRFDIGGMIGLGVKFAKLSVDARITRGFINYDQERTVENIFVGAKNLQNFNFQLTAGISF